MTGTKPWLGDRPDRTDRPADAPRLDVRWLAGFWALDGEYARSRTADGEPISAAFLKRYAPQLPGSPFAPALRLLSSVTRAEVKRWRVAVAERASAAGRGPRTTNQAVAAVARAYSYGVELEWLRGNPFAGMRAVRQPTPERRLYSHDELRRILSAPGWTDGTRLAVRLLAVTGLRAGELLALTPDYLEDAQVKVRGSWCSMTHRLKEPKTPGSSRDVLLIPEAVAALRDFAALSPWRGRGGAIPFLLWSPSLLDRPLGLKAVNKALVRAMSLAGIPREEQKRRSLDLHALRHLFTSEVHSAGLSEGKGLRLLGHSGRNVHDHYTHLIEEDLNPLFALQRRLWAAGEISESEREEQTG